MPVGGSDARRRRRTAGEPVTGSAGTAPVRPRWVWLLIAGLALGALGLGASFWWTPSPGAPAATEPVASMPAVAVAPVPAAAPAAPEPPSATLPTPADTSRPLARATTPSGADTGTGATDRERQARERRTQAERDKTGPRNARATATAPPREPQRLADTGPAATSGAPATPTPSAAPPMPTTAQTVDQGCADTSNFLTRDFCRVRACRNPALAGDPVCVRFREMEAAARRRENQ